MIGDSSSSTTIPDPLLLDPSATAGSSRSILTSPASGPTWEVSGRSPSSLSGLDDCRSAAFLMGLMNLGTGGKDSFGSTTGVVAAVSDFAMVEVGTEAVKTSSSASISTSIDSPSTLIGNCETFSSLFFLPTRFLPLPLLVRGDSWTGASISDLEPVRDMLCFEEEAARPGLDEVLGVLGAGRVLLDPGVGLLKKPRRVV